MKTTLLEGKKPAHFDKHIIGNLLLDVAPVDEVRQEKMLIGVRNEAGEIYRLIGAAKVNSFINAVEELLDLGLVDELKDTEDSRDGYDAIFSES
ncbi:hypothetical protein GCM10027321_29920 [Massilia terrae]|uniref:Uncharacterized protein n=1 Tax=Massilia terrae TaxID=1811224 RepID=A0ABT2D6E1_9BURK|nr:hypothetical protein [Massilia terrae]MCS0660935.1 hypothetical protein [Massilia terrae]